MTRGAIDDKAVVDFRLAQFPTGQRPTLVARPGFVDPDMQRHSCRGSLVNSGQRRAPFNRGQSAGVAMGQHLQGSIFPASFLPEPAQHFTPMFADRLATGCVFFGEPQRKFQRFFRWDTHRHMFRQLPCGPIQCPTQIDRRGPRGAQFPYRGFE